MRFHANYVSVSVDGEDETRFIEAHDGEHTGHFLMRRLEFTPESLFIELDRACDNLINLTFRMTLPEFEKASRVIRIISGEIEPESE